MIGKPFKYSYFHATLCLIIINIIIYLLTRIEPTFCAYLGMNPILVIKYKMFWQFITYMFVHQNMSHIFCNMLGLLFFGVSLEKSIGSKEFLLFYFFCGILSGVLSFAVYFFTGTFRVSLIGASGALYAVLFAYAVFFPRSIIYIWGIIPVPAPILVFIYALIELGSQFIGVRASVAHMTHLFGFLAAYLYIQIRMGINPFKIWKKTLE